MENSLHATAIHEAGHAVIGRALKLVCGYATIQADHDSAGNGVIADPWLIYSQWDAAERYRDIASVFRGRIMAFMAGAEAEIEILGNSQGGDGDDRTQCAYMAQELNVDDIYLQRLRRHTRRLVKHHRQKIELVASELLTRQKLSDLEIDELIAA